eukprot:3378652-Prymnesium_polylepis.1
MGRRRSEGGGIGSEPHAKGGGMVGRARESKSGARVGEQGLSTSGGAAGRVAHRWEQGLSRVGRTRGIP